MNRLYSLWSPDDPRSLGGNLRGSVAGSRRQWERAAAEIAVGHVPISGP